MTRVLLLNPPNELGYLNRDFMSGLGVAIQTERNFMDGLISKLKAGRRKMPVLSLAYLSSILSKDTRIEVIDAANTEACAEDVINESVDIKPDFVFATSSIPSLYFEVKFLEKIKQSTDAIVGFIGEAASIFSEIILKKNNIDFIIKNEPEHIAKKIINEEDYSKIPGIVYKKDNKIKDTGNAQLIENLDELPYPRWDYFPINKYGYFPILKKKPFVTMLSSRGCPYGCIYCPYTTFMGKKWRARTPDNVIDEMIYIKHKFRIKSVLFRDPIFSLDKERVAKICEKMINDRINIEWACETRIDCLDENLLSIMAESGCKGINVGIESTNPKILSNVKRKNITKDQIKKTISQAKKNNIQITGFFIFGLPGETKKTIQDNINFSLSIGLDYAEYKIATPFPGTELYRICVKRGWVNKITDLSNFPSFTSYNAYIKLNNISKEQIERYCSEAFKRFYFRREIMLQEIIKGNLLNFSLIKEMPKYTAYYLKNWLFKRF